MPWRRRWGWGTAIVRLGCFLHGCCFGTRSQLSWAIRFPAHSPAWDAQVAAGWIGAGASESGPVHPLQLYFLLLSMTAAAVALWLQPRKAYAGQVALVFLAVDQLGKFALERLRYESLPDVRWASFVIGMIAAALLSVTTRRHRPRRSRVSRPLEGSGNA